MIVSNGTTVKSTSRRKYRVERRVGTGGEGTTYEASRKRSSERWALKLSRHQYATDATAARTEFLIKSELWMVHSRLLGPRDQIRSRGLVGHVAPWCDGVTLEEFLQRAPLSLSESLALAARIAEPLAALHAAGIVHGDVQSNNVMMARDPDGEPRPAWIDFDNYVAPGQPPPNMLGQELYLAPEAREAREAGGPFAPNLESERFSVTAVLYEIVCWRHVAAGADGSPEEFDKTMRSGVWVHDPALSPRAFSRLGGVPAEALNTGLARLFRRGLSREPSVRPSAADWRDAIAAALQDVGTCAACGQEAVGDTSKNTCPYCGKPYPALALLVNGSTIPLRSAATAVGRNDVGGADAVSLEHAVLYRRGPVYRIEDRSSNGTFRRADGAWIRLPKGQTIRVKQGDVLRFANVEARVAQA
jgi:serine/threonine protein kinase